jgi:hypothetical protein
MSRIRDLTSSPLKPKLNAAVVQAATTGRFWNLLSHVASNCADMLHWLLVQPSE